MSKYQLYNFLITRTHYDFAFFDKSLRRLVKKKHIRAKNGKYYSPHVRPVSWNLRDKYTSDLFNNSLVGFKLLKTVPWIKLIAVTGAAASHNAVKNDDIDIFIVTEKN
ncbi:hypothetical protein ACFL0C_01195, partial [Patescibacteria group bacterium]